ncbi:MAG: SPOR domain-containing protein [Candidatus Aceula meridiana]|nr:SPOR domain-containing protein [Candidatus Aceula meridiana]
MKKIFFTYVSLIMILFFAGTSYAQPLEAIREAILEGDYSQAKDLSEQSLAKKLSRQEEEEVFYFLALSELYLGDYNKARGTFQRIVDGTKNMDLYDKASVGVVSSYYLDGEYREALKRCDDLLKERVDSNYFSSIYLKIARINLKLSHWDPARRYLKKILKEFPDSLEAYSAKQLLEEKKFFAVQVGAFLYKKYAKELVGRLREKGQYGYIVETEDKDGQRFYRVRVGELTSLGAAESLKDRLATLGFPTIIYP